MVGVLSPHHDLVPEEAGQLGPVGLRLSAGRDRDRDRDRTGTALLPPGRCLDRGGVPRGGVPRGGVELMDMKDAISCGKEGYIYGGGGDRRNLPA